MLLLLPLTLFLSGLGRICVYVCTPACFLANPHSGADGWKRACGLVCLSASVHLWSQAAKHEEEARQESNTEVTFRNKERSKRTKCGSCCCCYWRALANATRSSSISSRRSGIACSIRPRMNQVAGYKQRNQGRLSLKSRGRGESGIRSAAAAENKACKL